MIILAIESSTSSAKAMLYNTKTKKTKLAQEEYENVLDPTQLDPEKILKQTMDVAKRLCNGVSVDIVSLSGVWHSVFLMNQDFKPVTNAYQWNSTVASLICAAKRKDNGFAQNYYQNTGCVINSMYPYYKLMYLRQEGYRLQDYFILGQGDYNNHFLTGELITSECMASATGLLNIHTNTYDINLLKDLEINEDNLPRIITYRETYPLRKEAADYLGIRASIPVIATGGDGGLNQVGIGGLDLDALSFSVGTSAALRRSTKKPLLPKNPETWCYKSPLTYLIGASTSGAGSCISWYQKKFLPDHSYNSLDYKCSQNQDRPIFLPFIYGERSPGWRDDLKGGFEDVSSKHNIYDMYGAILEGTIFNCYQGYLSLLELHPTKPRIILSGGILYSEIWKNICVNIFGVEIEIPTHTQSSLLGSIILGLLILEKEKDIDLLIGSNKKIYPDMREHERYQKKYNRYLHFYDGLRN